MDAKGMRTKRIVSTEPIAGAAVGITASTGGHSMMLQADSAFKATISGR